MMCLFGPHRITWLGRRISECFSHAVNAYTKPFGAPRPIYRLDDITFWNARYPPPHHPYFCSDNAWAYMANGLLRLLIYGLSDTGHVAERLGSSLPTLRSRVRSHHAAPLASVFTICHGFTQPCERNWIAVLLMLHKCVGVVRHCYAVPCTDRQRSPPVKSFGKSSSAHSRGLCVPQSRL